jgi:solute:Na+ symporter, SSS family
MLLLGVATLIAKNIYQPLTGGAVAPARLMVVSRAAMLSVAVVALGLALSSPKELVLLLIFGYGLVTQLFPGIALGLAIPSLTTRPVLAGLLAGEGAVVWLISTGRDPYLGMNAGFVALVVNFAVTLAIWAIGRHRAQAEGPI